MLYSVDSQTYVDRIPHESEHRVWKSRLSSEEFNAIYEELNNRIEGKEIHTSSWIPGSDWSGTVFYPIYEKACLYDERLAAKCFGVILWQVIMERDDVWAFRRYENRGVPIEGMTYFRLNNPPPR